MNFLSENKLVPLRGENELQSRPQNEILVPFKISYDHPLHFQMGIPRDPIYDIGAKSLNSLTSQRDGSFYFYWVLNYFKRNTASFTGVLRVSSILPLLAERIQGSEIYDWLRIDKIYAVNIYPYLKFSNEIFSCVRSFQAKRTAIWKVVTSRSNFPILLAKVICKGKSTLLKITN